MENTPEFDAAGFFESQGLKFQGFDDKGNAKVESDTGERGTYDIKALLKSEGLDHNAKITYNTPDNPINESPVGVIDRLKLSLGNTKGSTQYLKSKFEDARVDSRGDLVVKDQGAWKRVDLDGLGDDSGWKVSEMLGDMADLGGDVLVGAGGLAGAIGGGGVASVGTAAAGSAAGSAAKAALGRIVGTYDATPQEVVKDIALDAVLGAVGEGVALGAKNMVMPAIAKGFKKIGSLGEATQDTMAKALSALDDEGVDAYRTMFANSEEVTKMAREYQAEAIKRATIKGAEQVSKEGLPESASVLYRTIAEEKATQSAAPLVENVHGMLSKRYGEVLDSLIDTHADKISDVGQKLGQNGIKIQNAIEQSLAEMGLLSGRARQVNAGPLKGTVQQKVTADSVLDALGGTSAQVDKVGAGKIANVINNARGFANALPNIPINSKAGIKRLINMQKDIESILDVLPPARRESLSALGVKGLSSLETAINNAFDDGLGKSFRTGLEKNKAWYRENKTWANNLVGPAYSNSNNTPLSARKLLDVMKESSRGSAQAKTILNLLAEITPNGNDHIQELAKRNAAMVLAGYRSTEAHTLSAVAARGAASAIRKVAVPTANVISKYQRKAQLKSFLDMPGYKRFAEGAKVLKSGGDKVLANPDLLGAGLTTMLSALQDDQQ